MRTLCNYFSFFSNDKTDNLLNSYLQGIINMWTILTKSPRNEVETWRSIYKLYSDLVSNRTTMFIILRKINIKSRFIDVKSLRKTICSLNAKLHRQE